MPQKAQPQAGSIHFLGETPVRALSGAAGRRAAALAAAMLMMALASPVLAQTTRPGAASGPSGPAAQGAFKHLKPDPYWTTEQRRCMSLLDLAVDVHAAHMWVKDKDLKETARQNFGFAKQLDLEAEFKRPPEYFADIVSAHEQAELRDAEAAERSEIELREARRTAARATKANRDMGKTLVELSEGNASLGRYTLQTVRSELLYARCMLDYTRPRAPLRPPQPAASGASAPASRAAMPSSAAASAANSPAPGTNAEIEAKCAGAAFLARESCIRNQCGDAKFAKASMCERRLRGQGADPAVTTN
jgi:hypothetical protein